MNRRQELTSDPALIVMHQNLHVANWTSVHTTIRHNVIGELFHTYQTTWQEGSDMCLAARCCMSTNHHPHTTTEHRLKTVQLYMLAASQTHRGGREARWNVRWWGKEVSTLCTINTSNPPTSNGGHMISSATQDESVNISIWCLWLYGMWFDSPL
jgi:hypothetical protein